MRTIRLDLTAVHDPTELAQILDEAVGYPRWYGPNLDAWLEMVTLYNQPGLARFRSQEPELFSIEIPYSRDLVKQNPRILLTAVALIGGVNQRSQQKTGQPILSLFLL